MRFPLFGKFLFLCLLICVQVSAVPNNATTSTTCPQGTLDCGFFKCVKEPTCPLDCYLYTNEQSCGQVRVNGVGCIWKQTACYRDIKCKLLPDNKCSQDCMDCGHFKCFPNGSGQCPAGCDSYPDQKSCQAATVFNGVGCQWANSTCGYREFEIRMAKPSAGDNHIGFMPSGNVDTEQTPNPNPIVANPTAGETPTMMDVKTASLAGPIAGVVVGVIAAGCMAFVLIHKRVEAKRQMKQQMAVHNDIEMSGNEVPKTLYRPQSLLNVVRNVLGFNSEGQNNASR
ncbi:hypothetical protein K493DRAFT_90013 [Basidiobolus meristosporus CBS 931.73]|uniref:4Fe-4S ferredoxin-type domain-containing protein n=1 Tax=Basidiobolus meristosporus CBS 931.73 TaxID=1314790 RepID=A0A1Y1YUS9_9FUNG|nr:hypothetical protein K493DRAFT_90013 [Basidiobolus meristosporus CBS 931.73]|eukprot:ORY01792.1 hypothetical protein K493DRAFT_90013 [Basidiobolus meristosporus CBS 931.73]